MARVLYPHRRSLAFDPALYQSLAQVALWRHSSVAAVVRQACMEVVAQEYKTHKVEPPHDMRNILPGQGEFSLAAVQAPGANMLDAPVDDGTMRLTGPAVATGPMGGEERPVCMDDLRREAMLFRMLTGGVEPELPTGGTPEELLAHIGRLQGELAACKDRSNPPLATTLAALTGLRVAAGQGGVPLPYLSETGVRRLCLQLRKALAPAGKLPVTP